MFQLIKSNKHWEKRPNNYVRILTMKKHGNFLTINNMGYFYLKIIDKSTTSEININIKISLILIEIEAEKKILKNQIERLF